MLHGASHWKATIHIYSLKKFQKIHKHIVFTTPCSKVQKAILPAFVLFSTVTMGVKSSEWSSFLIITIIQIVDTYTMYILHSSLHVLHILQLALAWEMPKRLITAPCLRSSEHHIFVDH